MAGKSSGGMGGYRPHVDDYKPQGEVSTHGYQPTGTGKPQSGHKPTTGQGGGGGTPPNQGSGGKK